MNEPEHIRTVIDRIVWGHPIVVGWHVATNWHHYTFPLPGGEGGTTLGETAMARAKRVGLASIDDGETAPELRKAPERLADCTTPVEYQVFMENKIVRAVRDANHCGEALPILEASLGAPLDTAGVYDTRGMYGNGSGSKSSGYRYMAYLDSDGKDCWGNEWRDKDGRDRNGLDMNGLDKDGFNREGFDREGFDREGKNSEGIHRDDPARFRFNSRGYDRDGYNRDGFNYHGWNREGKDSMGSPVDAAAYRFDSRGYDKDGFNRDGYNLLGESRSMAAERAARASARQVV